MAKKKLQEDIFSGSFDFGDDGMTHADLGFPQEADKDKPQEKPDADKRPDTSVQQ